jgi:hypothetical protein
MAFKDDLLRVLSGGIPALVDGPSGNSTTGTNNEGLPATVEQTPPEPQLQDREPFAMNGMNGNQVLFAGGAVLLAVIGAFLVARNI